MQQFLKTNPAERAQASSWLLFPLLLASAYAGVNANIQGVFSLLPVISEEFALTRAGAGLFSSFYFLSATGVAVFSGRLIDHLSPRKGLVFGVAAVAVVMLLTSWAPFYPLILVLALVCGLMFSIITPSVSRGIIGNVQLKKRALSMGIAHSGSGVGGMLSAALLPLIATVYGWRPAIRVSALSALVAAIIIFYFYPGDKKEVDASGPSAGLATGFMDSIKGLAANRQFLTICGFGILMGCVMSGVGAHYALFLHNDFQLSFVRAGMGLAMLQVGGIIGMPGWGLTSDRFFAGNRHQTLAAMAAAMALTTLVISLTAGRGSFGYAMILLMALVTGYVCLGTMGLFFTAVAESVEEGRIGVATGAALIFSRAGVIIAPPVFGYIADLTGSYRQSWLGLALLAALFWVVFMLRSRGRGCEHSGRS